MAQIGQDTMTERVDAFATVSSEHPVSPAHDLDGFGAVAAEFLAETATAADCSLCIAYLPGSGLSMGTAMEMYAAKAAGIPVVTVTGNVRNLTVLSTSDLVVSDLGQLPQDLETIRSDRGIAQ